MVCQKDFAVFVAIGTAPVRKGGPEEGDNWRMDCIGNMEGAGVAGNVECRQPFEGCQSQKAGFPHEIQGIRRGREVFDFQAHFHFSRSTGNDLVDMVFREQGRQLSPVGNGPFLRFSPCSRHEDHVGALYPFLFQEIRYFVDFLSVIVKGKFDGIPLPSQVPHHVQKLFNDVALFMGTADGTAGKETALSAIVVADPVFAAREEGNDTALGNHLEIDDKVKMMGLQFPVHLPEVGNVLDPLPVYQVDFINPGPARKDACKGRMHGPGNPGVRIELP